MTEILEKDSLNVEDRPVGFNVTEVPCTQHPLIDVTSVHIAADLQGTVLVVGLWCKSQERPWLLFSDRILM